MKKSTKTTIILVPLTILFVCVSATNILRILPAIWVSTHTDGDTKYILYDSQKYGNDFMSYINPFSGKDNYTVEIQKKTKDKNGIKVWKYNKTVDYGTRKPNIAN